VEEGVEEEDAVGARVERGSRQENGYGRAVEGVGVERRLNLYINNNNDNGENEDKSALERGDEGRGLGQCERRYHGERRDDGFSVEHEAIEGGLVGGVVEDLV
jgi:hypothetical protein